MQCSPGSASPSHRLPVFEAPPAAVAEQLPPSPEEPGAIAAQREQIRQLLDCPPSRAEEVVICGRRRGGPGQPYRLPLPPAGEEAAGPPLLGVELVPGVRMEPNVVYTPMAPANAASVKVKF
jgi:hypothetical protein